MTDIPFSQRMRQFLTFNPARPGTQVERPFFIMLTGMIAFVVAYSVYSNPHLRAPLTLALFISLAVLHTALHWIHTSYTLRFGQSLAYMVVQGLLAFSVAALAQNLAVILCLYMALIGEVSGICPTFRSLLVAVSGYMLLAGINFSMVFGWQSLGWWALAVVPSSVFVMVYVFLYNRQAEARQKSEALLVELEAANRQLTEYSARVEDLTIANERQRMARELHDTLSQGLAGLILQLEAADAHLANGRAERAQAIVRQTMERARQTLAEARQAIDHLRQDPSGVGDLPAALRQEVERFTQATGLPCQVEIDPLVEIPAETCEAALRAVSEGLTNIARHAKASQGWVRLDREDGYLKVEIQDDGCGFDPKIAVPAGHYGLLGMRERARLAGGRFELSSAPGQGTIVRVYLPLEKL